MTRWFRNPMFILQVAADLSRFAGSLLVLSYCSLAAAAAVVPAPTSTPGSGKAPAGNNTIKFRPASGGGLLGVAGDSAVIGNHMGGPIAAFDLRTGKRRRVLVPAARSGMPGREGALIDSYARGSVVLHGALVGPSGGFITSIDVESGQTRWRIQPGNPPADFDLRDTFQGVAAGALDVYGIGLVQDTPAQWRLEESVLAVDPASGKEKWRKLVEQHREPSSTGEKTLHLTADHTQIIAVTGTKVVALDPTTGTERWRRGFAEPPPRSQKVYPFALLTGRLAIAARTGFVQILDTQKGKLQSEVALPAGARVRQLALGAQALLAELEQASPSGVLSLAAFSLPSGQPTWTVTLASSVTQLTLRGEAVYVDTMGQGLRSLELATGKERFSMEDGGPFVFAPTPAQPERLVLSSGVVVPVLGSTAPLQEPYLRFDFAKTSDGQCQPSAASWIDGADRVVWTANLPKRTRTRFLFDCEHVAVYLRSPRTYRSPFYFLVGVLALDGSVFIGDLTGVLVLEQASGKRLLDLALPDVGKHEVAFDWGLFALSGKPTCADSLDRARIFQRCQDRVLYFDGNRAALLKTRPPRVEALGTYKGRRERGSVFEERCTLKLGKGTLTLEGTNFRDY